MKKDRENEQKNNTEAVTVGAGDLTWVTNDRGIKQQLLLHPDANLKVSVYAKKLILTKMVSELGSEWVNLGLVKEGDKITADGLIFKPGSQVSEEFFIGMNGKAVHLRIPVAKRIRRD